MPCRVLPMHPATRKGRKQQHCARHCPSLGAPPCHYFHNYHHLNSSPFLLLPTARSPARGFVEWPAYMDLDRRPPPHPVCPPSFRTHRYLPSHSTGFLKIQLIGPLHLHGYRWRAGAWGPVSFPLPLSQSPRLAAPPPPSGSDRPITAKRKYGERGVEKEGVTDM